MQNICSRKIKGAYECNSEYLTYSFLDLIWISLSQTHLKYAFCVALSGWSSWGDWGKCSNSCGSGVQERMRICIISSPSNSSVCGSVCPGPSVERRQCVNIDCSGLKTVRLFSWNLSSVVYTGTAQGAQGEGAGPPHVLWKNNLVKYISKNAK